MQPTFPAAFRGKTPQILILDVDGVLTNNQISLDPAGSESKAFHVPDGAGLRWLKDAGVAVALVSGRTSQAVARRAAELDIEHYTSGVKDKGPAVRTLLDRLSIRREQAVYVGDDLVDLPAFREVGLPVAVANAHPLVTARAAAVTTRAGGDGAVREVCEWILATRGEWQRVVERFMK
ncbi:MAG: HAD-IIIA family hydrolase [Planctomycetes bacterium]|nr:HAD-IIIA family hydrolase [Planctomycetota bacterium]